MRYTLRWWEEGHRECGLGQRTNKSIYFFIKNIYIRNIMREDRDREMWSKKPTHNLHFSRTVSSSRAWRWPWSSCWGRRRCLRCCHRTSWQTTWSAFSCRSRICTKFWLCNSSECGKRKGSYTSDWMNHYQCMVVSWSTLPSVWFLSFHKVSA